MNCSAARSRVVGERWSQLIVAEALCGVTRFDDFRARLGISRTILTDRLNLLVNEGVFERLPYQEHPRRFEYHLTDKGRDLRLVVAVIEQWEDRWDASPSRSPFRIRHDLCGRVVQAVGVCSYCGEPLQSPNMTDVGGSGPEGNRS